MADFLRFQVNAWIFFFSVRESVVRSCVESQRKKLSVLYSLKNQDGEFLADFSSVAVCLLMPEEGTCSQARTLLRP